MIFTPQNMTRYVKLIFHRKNKNIGGEQGTNATACAWFARISR